MQNTIEHDCCNYLSERCVLYDDGDYPLCVQHGLRYLVCPYFRDVVIHNNADLMAELLGIPQNAKQCRECGKFFLPKHRNSLYRTDTCGGLLEWWHDPGVPLAFPVESASS